MRLWPFSSRTNKVLKTFDFEEIPRSTKSTARQTSCAAEKQQQKESTENVYQACNEKHGKT